VMRFSQARREPSPAEASTFCSRTPASADTAQLVVAQVVHVGQ
jgi:hypothetical protein